MNNISSINNNSMNIWIIIYDIITIITNINWYNDSMNNINITSIDIWLDIYYNNRYNSNDISNDINNSMNNNDRYNYRYSINDIYYNNTNN